MTDQELIARLRDRAKEDRQIQSNNEGVAAALKGQRLLFDQGFRSQSNTFAVRLALDYERCAKKDAELAADWEAAADRIEEVVKERDDIGRKLNTARYGQPDFAWSIHEEAIADLRAKLAKAVEALREIADEASVAVRTWKNGINFKKMYGGWRAIAVARIDIARKTLAELEVK